MAYECLGILSFTAGADMVAGRLVTFDGSVVNYAAANSTNHMGVTLADARSGYSVPVGITEGAYQVLASSAIAAGALLNYAANGAVVTDAGTSALIIGQAITGGTDELITAKIYPTRPHATST